MGRPERQLSGEDTPLTEFAGRLRALRLAAGQPSYRRLAVLTHYSAATLARAAGGQALPSLEVALAYAAACGGDPREWQRAWAAVEGWTKSRPAAAAAGPAQVGPAQVGPPVSRRARRRCSSTVRHSCLLIRPISPGGMNPSGCSAICSASSRPRVGRARW